MLKEWRKCIKIWVKNNMSVFIEESIQEDVKGCRAFIAAILDQAFSDALSRNNSIDKRTALNFIDEKNDMFIYYCELLDLESEYVEKQMIEKIRNHRFKPLKKFRE